MVERDSLGRKLPQYKRRQPATISTEERDRIILALRRRKWSYAQIAKHVGISKSGVIAAIQRNTQPAPRQPGDTGTLGTPDEQW